MKSRKRKRKEKMPPVPAVGFFPHDLPDDPQPPEPTPEDILVGSALKEVMLAMSTVPDKRREFVLNAVLSFYGLRWPV